MKGRTMRKAHAAGLMALGIAITVSATAAVAAPRVRLPAKLLGGWCLMRFDPGDDYGSVYTREDCTKQGNTADYIELKPNGYDGRDKSCKTVSSSVKILHKRSSKYFNAPGFSDEYTVRYRCRREGATRYETKTITLEKGVLLFDDPSRPIRPTAKQLSEFLGTWIRVDATDAACRRDDWKGTAQYENPYLINVTASAVETLYGDCKISSAWPRNWERTTVDVELSCSGEGYTWNSSELWDVQQLGDRKVFVQTELRTSNRRDDAGKRYDNSQSGKPTTLYLECK